MASYKVFGLVCLFWFGVLGVCLFVFWFCFKIISFL